MNHEDPARSATGILSGDLLYEATIRQWWLRRWFIIGSVLIAGVLFAAVLLNIPKSFRAQASVIVMPPRFVPEVRTQPLTVNTAQELLNTPELHQQVIVTLRRQHDLALRLNNGSREYDVMVLDGLAAMSVAEIVSRTGATDEEAAVLAELDRTEIQGLLDFKTEELAELNVDAVGEMLTSKETVEKKTASDLVFSPMLKLYGVSDTGSKAQVLANTWARLFEKKYDLVARRQTEKLNASLETLQREGQQDLESIQKELVEYRLQHNQDLVQRQIKDYSDAYSSITVTLVSKRDSLSAFEAGSRGHAEILRALETDGGSWIGSPGVRLSAGNSGTDEPFDFLDSPRITEDLATSSSILAHETLRNRIDLQNSLDQIARFQAENPVELLKADEARYREDYLEQKSKYYESAVEKNVLLNSLKGIDSDLAGTSRVVELIGSLPDETIGDALISGDSRRVERAGALKLQKEILNPVWKTLSKNRVQLNQELLLVQARIAELDDWLPKEEKEVARISQRVFRVQQAEKLAINQLSRHENLNQLLYQQYEISKRDYLNCVLQATIIREEIISLEQMLAQIREDIEVLRAAYENAESAIEVMELRKNAIGEQAELLTQKLQASLVAIGEDVTDVTIAAKAVAPARHFFPPRTVLVLGAMFLTAAIIMAGLSRRRYLQVVTSR